MNTENTSFGKLHLEFKQTNYNCRYCYSDNISVISFDKDNKNKILPFEHNHSLYEFCIPYTPIPFILINGIFYFGEIGMVFSAPSGCNHGIKYDISNVSFINIKVRKDFFENQMKKKNIKKFSAIPFKASEELKFYVNSFQKEFSKEQNCDMHKLMHLEALICNELIENQLNLDENNEKTRFEYQRGVQSAYEFISKNYSMPNCLNEVIKACGFSRNYFTTSFRRMFGDTPLTYLTRLRISKAKHLLETTDDSIKTISQKCGFTRQNTFTHAFKTYSNINPSQYRKQNR